MAKKPQLWSGRFKEPVDEQVKRFTASVGFDQRLAKQDIRGSLAHARMLAACGILSRRDLTAIERGLARVGRAIDRGRFKWSLEAEDVHFNIERRLTALVREAGKRLHTARSRNDQVATDLRLWLRDEIDALRELIAALIEALLAQAAKHAALVMPGVTHLQVAQPVTFGHHLLAYVEMLERDRERLAQCRSRVNRLPLGAAALAGTGFPIDRSRVARELGFEGLCENSLDAVAGRVAGLEPVPAAMHAAVLAGHATATDLADYLVRKGMAFRDAHEVVARAVREAEISGRDLAALPLESLRRFSPRIGADVKRVLTPEGSVAARRHRGGTAPAEVRKAVARARKRLSK